MGQNQPHWNNCFIKVKLSKKLLTPAPLSHYSSPNINLSIWSYRKAGRAERRRAGRRAKRLFVNSSNRNIKEFYVLEGGRLLNMVLKDMSNKIGCDAVPESQIKNNRRRKRGGAHLEARNRVVASRSSSFQNSFRLRLKPHSLTA